MIRKPNALIACGLLALLVGLTGAKTGFGKEEALRAMAEAFRTDFLAKQGHDFGKKRSDETKDGKRIAVGDLFLSKKVHALVYFKTGVAGAACFEKGEKEWTLLGVWPHSKAGLAAIKKVKKQKPFDLRNLSSDKAPEFILLDGAEGERPRYRAFRYVRKDGAIKEIAQGIADPYWDPGEKEVLAFDWISDDSNCATAWRWSKGVLKPSWRCLQRVLKGKGREELILTFHQRKGDRWLLVRRLRGTIPFYANPAPREILEPIHTTGKMDGRLSTPKKSYDITASLGVMRIASFEMSMQSVLDQFSRGLFADPDSFGPRFRLHLPSDEDMYIAQFGRVRCKPDEHKRWEAPKDEKGLVTNARALLAAIGNNDVFALAKLVPAEAKASLFGLQGAQASEKVSPEATEAFLDALPELLQEQSGKATSKIEGDAASVRVQAFPARPGGRKAVLVAGYKKADDVWILASLKLEWSTE